MTHKHPIRPVRTIPKQFSWVDHRLVRDHHLERCSHQAAALYLFLVTVADCQGLSYYSDTSIGQRLAMDHHTLKTARRNLLEVGLIAFERPLYQVLALDAVPRPSQVAARGGAPMTIGEILKQLAEGPS